MAHAEKCPVCDGTGKVPNGFYSSTSGEWVSTSAVPETCRSCGGTGWVTVHDCRQIFYGNPDDVEIIGSTKCELPTFEGPIRVSEVLRPDSKGCMCVAV